MRNKRKGGRAEWRKMLAVGLLSALPLLRLSAQDRVTVQVLGHDLQVPRGFSVDLYAEIPNARMMALGPDGAVYVASMDRGTAGKIYRLVDFNHDGTVDSTMVVHEGLTFPHSIAFRGDTMYVAQTTSVVKFAPGATTPTVVIPDIPGRGHFTRTIVFGPDGKLYLSVGSSCNICNESSPQRAAVWRYNPDGTGGEAFATGLRNSVGLAFEPTTHELWATNNDRDNLGDDVPPDRINILRAGRYYGWPRCNLPNTPNPEYQGADCSRVEAPALTFQAHSAPLGITFYTGSSFPADFRGDVLFAQHGSWNRSTPVGYQVSRAHVRNGRPIAPQVFVTGFRPEGGEAWERPVGLLVLPDGSLLVSGDSPGHVFRVHWAGR